MSRKKARRREGVAQPELHEPVTQALTRRWVHWLVPALIALVTFAAFLPALQNQFVNWDDHENFLDNPHYRGSPGATDRKSTRLNSSHGYISYAVFCLKKKKN